jgi:hypothetical protein
MPHSSFFIARRDKQALWLMLVGLAGFRKVMRGETEGEIIFCCLASKIIIFRGSAACYAAFRERKSS